MAVVPLDAAVMALASPYPRVEERISRDVSRSPSSVLARAWVENAMHVKIIILNKISVLRMFTP